MIFHYQPSDISDDPKGLIPFLRDEFWRLKRGLESQQTDVRHDGDITMTGLGKRFKADFSNTTIPNRMMFQTTTVNGSTILSTIPDGTGTISGLNSYGGLDPANSSLLQAVMSGTTAIISATKRGTGSFGAMQFYTSDTLAHEIDTAGVSFFYSNVVIPKTSGFGIKVDTSTPTFPWRDILGRVIPKAIGVGSPARAVYSGANVADYAFALNDVCDFNFHIPHDYLPGSDIFFHIHWSHNDATSVTGNAQFTAYHTYCKGHNQANFPAEKNVVVTYATTNLATTPRYRHRIDEVQLSTAGGSGTLIDSSLIEPDGVIILTLQLTGLPTFGGAGKLFIHECDLHYQSTNIGTKQKAPAFYV